MYSADELARAADFLVRRVPVGGVVERSEAGQRVLEIGPDATDDEIVRAAARYIIFARENTHYAAEADFSEWRTGCIGCVAF